MKLIDLSGYQAPHFTVLRRQGSYRSPHAWSTQALWLCRCECGTEFLARSDRIRGGQTKSCGCLRDEQSRRRMLENNPRRKTE